MKKCLITVLIIFLLLQMVLPICSSIAAESDILITSAGVTIRKTSTINQVISQYGSEPKLVTPSAFGGNTYTFYKGNYENVLYLETNSNGTIISYGALSNDFTTSLYSAGSIASNKHSYLEGTVSSDIITKKVGGIVTYRQDLVTEQIVKQYCVEFMKNSNTYEKYYAKHSVIMLNYFLKKSGCTVTAEFNEDLYDTVKKIMQNGKSVKQYAEENNKQIYYKQAGTDLGTGALWNELPNPLRAAHYAKGFYPTEDKKYAYLNYSMSEQNNGNSYSGGTSGYYFSKNFIEKNNTQVSLTTEEQTKYNNAKQYYDNSISTFNQNGTDYYTKQPNYKTLPLVAGNIKENKLQGATGFLNAIRVGAGLSTVNYESSLSYNAQHKATLTSYISYNHISNPNPHYPQKPSGVDQNFYDIAQANLSFENLYSGDMLTSLKNALDDKQGDTIKCGHRYNLLRPGATQIGFGYTNGQSVHRLSGYGSINVDAVAWPSIGITPVEAYNNWGYWTCKFYKKYATTDNTQINVRCLNNGKEWNFITQATTGDNIYSKMTDMVTFYNEDMIAENGYVYMVTIKNLKNNQTNVIENYQYRTVFKSLSSTTGVVYPTSVALDKTQIRGVKGSKFELKTTFSNNNPTEIRTKWSSSNTKVATVNQYGEVTIVGTGITTITVETLNGKSAICTVQSTNTINNLKFEKDEYILKESNTQKINVTEATGIVIDEKAITWKISDNTKASINNGLLLAIAEGEIKLTANYAGNSATCKVKILPRYNYPPSLKIRANDNWFSSDMLAEGQTTTLNFIQQSKSIYLDKIEADLVYDSTNIEIVKVEPKFEGISYKVISDGKIHFLYTSNNNVREIQGILATITIKGKKNCVYAKNQFDMENIKLRYYGEKSDKNGVFQYPESITTSNTITNITLSKSSYNFSKVNESVKLNATISPKEHIKDSTIKWSSSNNNIAIVNQTGIVTARGKGVATIIATTANGKTATCKVTVNTQTTTPPTTPTVVPITKISLSPTSTTIKKGTKLKIIATINPTNTTQSKTITWTTNNSAVATVSSTGEVIAKGNGTTIITAKTSNGKTASCRVTVYTPTTPTPPTQNKPTTPTKPSTPSKPTTSTNTSTQKATPNISYRTHVQNIGWQSYVKNGKMAGTSGRCLRLEGININLENNKYGGGISYQTHIQNIGWQKNVQNGAMSGTSGKCLRLEGIKIKLTGQIANYYDVYYRVHCQNVGWLDWAKNGEPAGSEGFSYRLEGIEICLVKKGGKAPGKTNRHFVQKYLNYQTHVQNIGWQNKVQDKEMSGTSGKSLRLEGIKIALQNKPCSGNIEYRTHVQNIGWQNFVKNGAMSGTNGRSLRLEAIQIRLTGEIAKKYDIYYRVHCQNFGWMGWAKNGQSAGSAGYCYRLEGIEICLVEKGSKAPGTTTNCFRSR